MNDKDIKKQYKEKLLKTFEMFNQFCKDNKLIYFLAYGTTLGAVRHGGLIPWDDDIDVYMPIESYDRFLQLKNNMVIPYRIDDLRDKGYFKCFAKFSDANTTLVQGSDLPFVYGVFIDVFPFYEGSVDDFKQWNPQLRKYIWKYEMASRIFTFKDLFKSATSESFRNFLGKLKYRFVYRLFKAYYYNEYRKIEKKCRMCKGDYYIYFGASNFGCYPKEWFATTVEMKFENQTCRVCGGYHQYLTQEYGDYMTPPPLEVQQQPSHPFWYMNLDRYIPLKEVRKIMKKRT